MPPPSGCCTLDQLFARHVKPGARPIADMKDDRVTVYAIVSPADSAFVGRWTIDSKSSANPEGRIEVERLELSIRQLLEDK